jgi:predicted extracellular nuclease
MQLSATGPATHTPLLPREAGQLRFGQLNAHNLFDTKDDRSTQEPVYTQQQLRSHVSKLATAIRDGLGSPDVVTMQEVENADLLKKLVAHQGIRELGYVPLLREGTDSRGIDNAILYRPESVTLRQTMQINPERVLESGRSSRLFTRPPLAATFSINGREQATEGVREFTVIANHFTSKLGGEEAAAKRAEQALMVARFAKGLQAVDPQAGVLVAGDFNMEASEPEFAPLLTGTSGLVDATASIPEADRFTWRDGRKHFQLDHVLVSPNIAPHISTAIIPHISTKIARGAASDPVRAEGFSDHDPVVVTFTG